MKNYLVVITILAVAIIAGLAGLVVTYINGTSAVSDKSVEVNLEIKENQTYSTLGSILYKNELIKSELIYKIYIKLNTPNNLQKGMYKLNKNMNLKEILEVLKKGSNYNPDLIRITFKEGWNIRKIALEIEKKVGIDDQEVINTIANKTYLNELINKYWFLEDTILDSKIYYPLEGYLFPETYEISKKNSVEEIIEILLNHTNKILTEHKKEIENSKYTIHEILTLASLIELEAGAKVDRAGVAGVFYNRLNAGWSLGSDVTTYYASKIDDWRYSLTYKELNDCNNSYNTRCKTYVGLPIGPIANPGSVSIVASIKPSIHNYYYFVADCKGKTYLNTNASGHANIINKLKQENNWCA